MIRSRSFSHIFRTRDQSGGGFALVVVLSFIALLVVLVLAYFSHAALQREVSNSSSNLARTDIFSRGALNTIIGDLQQEIAAGSSVTNVIAGGVTNTLYFPSNSLTVVPAVSGGFSRTNGLENLLKISKSGQPFYAGTNYDGATYPAANRAAGSATTTPSKNGRSLSLARWNAALLLGRSVSTSTNDYTPVPSFLTPDWILMTRGGSNPTTWSANLKWSAKFTDTNVVVGRYAYAIYDEGGLLDANVAGSPSSVSTSASGYKNAVAYADLSQIGLTSAQVDSLVNWRNYATLNAGGGAAINFVNFVNRNQSGFLRAGNTTLASGESDRRFVSRQQMIEFFKDVLGGTSDTLNSMQYLGTFSRDINQASLRPPSGRPVIAALSSGGNDKVGSDNVVNPAFLEVRNSNGEPVAKKRFPLERLAWLTYLGPSSGRTGADITDLKSNLGVSQSLLDEGSASNIASRFGLRWNSSGLADGSWSYDVNLSSGGSIKTLAEVAAESPVREPNFVELLKASITAGALAKGASYTASSSSTPADVRFVRDTTLDYQVIQIAANIIDQADVDGYPTRIQYFGREFVGVENLPYLYRLRNAVWRVVDPSPMPTETTYGAAQSQTRNSAYDTASNCGLGMFVQLPEIWNPHGYNDTSTATIDRSMGNPRPGTSRPLRLEAESEPGTAIFTRGRKNNGGTSDGPPTGARALSAANTRMEFNNAAALYREPTLLIKRGVPAGSALDSAAFTSAASGLVANGATVDGTGVLVKGAMAQQYNGVEPGTPGHYLGIYLGHSQLIWNSGTNTFLPAQLWVNGSSNSSNTAPNIYYRMLYDDPGGTYRVYDEKHLTIENFTSQMPSTILDTNTAFAGQTGQILGWARFMNGFDPRTSRFGFFASRVADGGNRREFPPGWRYPGVGGTQPPQWVDRANNVLSSDRPDSYGGYGANGPANATLGWQTDSNMVRYGLSSQNLRTVSLPNRGRFRNDPAESGSSDTILGTTNPQYYADADGVVRRGMGGNVSTIGGTTTGLPLATAFYTPINGDPRQKESRPIILNRPFRSVAELGCVFSDTPWKNLDFSTPESGFAPLLDVFCLTETESPSAIVAGKVNLNTRQSRVLKAILSGAYKDEYNGFAQPLSAAEADALSLALISRTSGSSGPLANLSSLSGSWVSGTGASASYDGFSVDVNSPDTYSNNISRFREAPLRALSSAGQTRVWNLLIDVVVQTGRYVQSSTNLDDFQVEGEQRVWCHVAIDRFTGQVLDQQVEIVRE